MERPYAERGERTGRDLRRLKAFGSAVREQVGGHRAESAELLEGGGLAPQVEKVGRRDFLAHVVGPVDRRNH